MFLIKASGYTLFMLLNRFDGKVFC